MRHLSSQIGKFYSNLFSPLFPWMFSRGYNGAHFVDVSEGVQIMGQSLYSSLQIIPHQCKEGHL